MLKKGAPVHLTMNIPGHPSLVNSLRGTVVECYSETVRVHFTDTDQTADIGMQLHTE